MLHRAWYVLGDTEWMWDLSGPRDGRGEQEYFFHCGSAKFMVWLFSKCLFIWNGTFDTGCSCSKEI